MYLFNNWKVSSMTTRRASVFKLRRNNSSYTWFKFIAIRSIWIKDYFEHVTRVRNPLQSELSHDILQPWIVLEQRSNLNSSSLSYQTPASYFLGRGIWKGFGLGLEESLFCFDWACCGTNICYFLCIACLQICWTKDFTNVLS